MHTRTTLLVSSALPADTNTNRVAVTSSIMDQNPFRARPLPTTHSGSSSFTPERRNYTRNLLSSQLLLAMGVHVECGEFAMW
jgi:hypothetical protein